MEPNRQHLDAGMAHLQDTAREAKQGGGLGGLAYLLKTQTWSIPQVALLCYCGSLSGTIALHREWSVIGLILALLGVGFVLSGYLRFPIPPPTFTALLLPIVYYSWKYGPVSSEFGLLLWLVVASISFCLDKVGYPITGRYNSEKQAYVPSIFGGKWARFAVAPMFLILVVYVNTHPTEGRVSIQERVAVVKEARSGFSDDGVPSFEISDGVFRWASNNGNLPIVIKSAVLELLSAKKLNDNATLLTLAGGYIWLSESHDLDAKTYEEYIKTLPIPKSLPDDVRQAASWQFLENQTGNVRKVQLLVQYDNGQSVPRAVASGSVFWVPLKDKDCSGAIACIGLPDYSTFADVLAHIAKAHRTSPKEIDLITGAEALGKTASALFDMARWPENEAK